MDTRTFITPAQRVLLKSQIPQDAFLSHQQHPYVAIASGETPRIIGAGDDMAELTERMEQEYKGDVSVPAFFVTANPVVRRVPGRRKA